MLADIASGGYAINCLVPGTYETFKPQFDTDTYLLSQKINRYDVTLSQDANV
jgi:hypothetical protein